MEENAATLGTAALGGLRIAAGRISNQIFTFQRYRRVALARYGWLIEQPPQLRVAEAGALATTDLPRPLTESYEALATHLLTVPTFAEHPAACAAARAALARLMLGVDRLPPSVNRRTSSSTRLAPGVETFDEKLTAAQVWLKTCWRG